MLPEQRDGSTTLRILVGALALAVCCGAPLLIGALLATGVGATFAAAGWPALGIPVAAVGVVVLLSRILRRRRVGDLATDKAAPSKGLR